MDAECWLKESTYADPMMCAIIHQKIDLSLGLLQDWKPYYRHVPVNIFEKIHYLFN